MNKCLSDALAIGELAESMYNISHDDNKQLADYTMKELVNEAKYVLSTFHEAGHNNNDWLNGEWEESFKWELVNVPGKTLFNRIPSEYSVAGAKAQVKQLKAFIKKYG